MPPLPPSILTINGGSSSTNFALFETGDSLRRILQGEIARIGLPGGTFQVAGSATVRVWRRSAAATRWIRA